MSTVRQVRFDPKKRERLDKNVVEVIETSPLLRLFSNVWIYA